MKSKKFYEEVMSVTTPKGRRSLENVKKICDSLEERNLNLSLSLIGRETEKLGISPSYHSIKSSKRLKEYIRLRSEEYERELNIEIDEDNELKERIIMLERENDCLRSFIKKMDI